MNALAAVSQTNSDTSTLPVSGSASDGTESGYFENILNAVLHPNAENKVSEEELFAAVVKERLATLKGKDVADKYGTLLQQATSDLKKSDGFIPYEQAANRALGELKKSGDLTDVEYDKVFGESFQASQLDTNAHALYDDRGGSNDPTVAVSLMESAIASAKAAVSAFDSGSASVAKVETSASTPVTPDGNKIDGANGFLFKPISSGDGKLAILMPELFAHDVKSVVLKDSEDKELDHGVSTGYGEEGTREKYSFSKPGASYGSNVKVDVTLFDGTIQSYLIPDPAQRYD